MTPLVSIVTPLFNGEKLIETTLASVVAQDWADWELIVVDDCSTDGSAAIVRDWAGRDPRIRSHRLKSNSGAAVARNTGIRLAAGRYLCFLDSDDLWLPDKLSRQLAFMQSTGAAFSFTEYAMIDEQGNTIKDRVASPPRINFRGLLSGRPIMCSSVMLDQSQVGSVEMPDIRSGQDYATWALLLRDRVPFARNVGAVLARYRKQQQSLSANKLRALRRTWRINRKILRVSWPVSVALIAVYAGRWLLKHFA